MIRKDTPGLKYSRRNGKATGKLPWIGDQPCILGAVTEATLPELAERICILLSIMSRFFRRPTLLDQYLRGQLSFAQYQAARKRKLQTKIQWDIDAGNTDRAIKRLEGSMRDYAFDPDLWRWLATLYLVAGQDAKAGKYFYLVDQLTAKEQAAVAVFEKSLGNCPLGISRKLTPLKFFRYDHLPVYARQRYQELLLRIEARFGCVPNFLIGLKHQLRKHGIGTP